MRTKLIQLRKNKSSLLIFKSQEVTVTSDGKIIFKNSKYFNTYLKHQIQLILARLKDSQFKIAICVT